MHPPSPCQCPGTALTLSKGPGHCTAYFPPTWALFCGQSPRVTDASHFPSGCGVWAGGELGPRQAMCLVGASVSPSVVGQLSPILQRLTAALLSQPQHRDGRKQRRFWCQLPGHTVLCGVGTRTPVCRDGATQPWGTQPVDSLHSRSGASTEPAVCMTS